MLVLARLEAGAHHYFFDELADCGRGGCVFGDDAVAEKQLRERVVEGEGKGRGEGQDAEDRASGKILDERFLPGHRLDVQRQNGLRVPAVVLAHLARLPDLAFRSRDGLASLKGDQPRDLVLPLLDLRAYRLDHVHLFLGTSPRVQLEGRL